MADIKPYTDQIQNAVYGEEVRSSIVNALNKVNDDNNQYLEIKESIVGSKEHIDEQVKEFDDKVKNAESIQKALTSSTSYALTAKTNLEEAITDADASKANLEEATESATTINNALSSTVNAANELEESLKEQSSNASSYIEELENLKPFTIGDGIKIDDTNKISLNIGKAPIDTSEGSIVTNSNGELCFNYNSLCEMLSSSYNMGGFASESTTYDSNTILGLKLDMDYISCNFNMSANLANKIVEYIRGTGLNCNNSNDYGNSVLSVDKDSLIYDGIFNSNDFEVDSSGIKLTGKGALSRGLYDDNYNLAIVNLYSTLNFLVQGCNSGSFNFGRYDNSYYQTDWLTIDEYGIDIHGGELMLNGCNSEICFEDCNETLHIKHNSMDLFFNGTGCNHIISLGMGCNINLTLDENNQEISLTVNGGLNILKLNSSGVFINDRQL